MLLKGRHGIAPGLVIALTLLAVTSILYASARLTPAASNWIHSWKKDGTSTTLASSADSALSRPSGQSIPATQQVTESHYELFSHSTTNGSYFFIKFGDYPAINPNIIPHPQLNDTWIIVAQQHKYPDSNQMWLTELVCDATFREGRLQCVKQPMILTIGNSLSTHCEGDLAFLNFNVGPHDARVFWGPKHPFVVYGSQSAHTCFGQWIQDFRVVTNWRMNGTPNEAFFFATDLQRPPPYHPVEKNYFIFWDLQGEMYVHYDVAPQRVFAKLSKDGSVGEDLAPYSREHDERCLDKHLGPSSTRTLDHMHQATNSLVIVMCNRSDPTCHQTPSNTFIFTVFQQKTYVDWHSVYEPFVMLFEQQAPFRMHAVSTKPLWIHGRRLAIPPHELPTEWVKSRPPLDQHEMMYVTSMNWMNRGQNHTGYLDDMLLVGFGIEDCNTGGIDVMAKDLLGGIGLCSDDG